MKESDVLFWIRDNISSDPMDTLMVAASYVCTADIIWFLISLVLMSRKDTRKAGITLLIALIVSIIICNLVLKPMVGRVRPYDALGVGIIVPESTEFSFPSGHTTGVTVMLCVAIMYLRRWIVPMTVFAGIVMFSRLYLFMHYPTDILGGVLVGVVSTMISYTIVYYIGKRYPKVIGDGV